MQVMVLAAGKSTRLGALGAVLPKPLAPVCGHPAITYGLALCRHAGLRDVVINVHHHGDLIREALGDGARFGVSIRYSVEEELLGTGGGIAHARPLFRPGPLLVINGKLVADVDLAAVIAAHHAGPRGVLATMVVRDDPDLDRWSPVTVDGTGRVVSVRGQGAETTAVGATTRRMFTGIHILEPALLDRLPRGRVSDVFTDAYIPALLAGGFVGSMTVSGHFAENSTPELYLESNRALLRAPDLVPHPPGPLVGVDPAAIVDQTARIVPPVRVAAGAVIESGAVVGPETVIGEGARVAAGALVERSVVWPGAVVSGDCLDRVAMSDSPPTSPRP